MGTLCHERQPIETSDGAQIDSLDPARLLMIPLVHEIHYYGGLTERQDPLDSGGEREHMADQFVSLRVCFKLVKMLCKQ